MDYGFCWLFHIHFKIHNPSDPLYTRITYFKESVVFLLGKLTNCNSSNLLNNIFRTFRLVIRGQGGIQDPYFTRFRTKFDSMLVVK